MVYTRTLLKNRKHRFINAHTVNSDVYAARSNKEAAMNSIVLTLAVLALPSLALAQCPSDKKYDRFADKTTEICDGLYAANNIESDASSADTFTVTVHVE
jgi:hypothetical protein